MTSKQKNLGQLTFGLDIGIASLGWAVLGKDRIVDLGVRAFDKAETADKGESLNLVRRSARLLRRRLRRRAWRLTKLARLFKREGLISDVNVLKAPPQKGAIAAHPWQLRVAGLDRLLTPEEWARVIYHLCKHRGFHWTSRAEEAAADSDKEGGKVKKGLADTKKLILENNYRTAAAMVLAEFPDAQRNKHGDYSKALSRTLLNDELEKLFKAQRLFGNPHCGSAFQTAILDKKRGLFWAQKPALAGEDLLKMLGRCTFEKSEYRAPKASFTAERHVWLTRLNNLRIVEDGKIRSLTEAERCAVLPLPYLQAVDFTYKQLGSALVKAGFLVKEGYKFVGLAYPSARQKAEEKAKDPEAAVLVKLPAWQTLRKTLTDAGCKTEWEGIAGAANNGNPLLLDGIAWVLSVYKDDQEVETKLRELALPNAENLVSALLTVRFDKFSNLSLKALRNIVPQMERGLRYDEACLEAGYHHSQLQPADAEKRPYLPPFYSGRDSAGRMVFNEDMDIPRNPVVLRALNQARKVVNALIREYGAPHSVHIEMARDLSRPAEERKKVKDAQEEFRERNDKDKANFASQFNIVGRIEGKDFDKYQLYREQQSKCAYSQQPLDINRLLEAGYVEIDHVLPYARSFDDSKNNKVLVLTRENRNKGDQTPYEYLDGANNSTRWREFVAFVESNKLYRQAKRNRLLKKDFNDKDATGFRERNLNDTRYICRFFKNYVEQYLQLHTDSTAKRCVVLSGSLTSLLRARWGLVKVRGANDRHHALDAVVVAACGHQVVQRLSTIVNAAGWAHKPEMGGYVQVDTGEFLSTRDFVNRDEVYRLFPRPWRHFRDELVARLNMDDPEQLRAAATQFGTYPPAAIENLHPLFVSRAPQRRNGGAVHKETIYGKARDGHVLFVKPKDAGKKEPSETQATRHQASTEEKRNLVIERIGVMDKDVKGNYKFTLQKLENIIDPSRNEWMIGALHLWLEGREEREKQAKEIEAETGRGKQKRPLTDLEQAKLEELRALPRKPLKHDPECGPFTGPIIRTVKLNAGKTTGIEIRNGIATNDSMLRVDIFAKAGKFHLVPVYVHHRVSGLPNRAIVQSKDESEWTLIDDSFQFLFTLYPNDLVRVSQKGKLPILGYYSSCHRGTGNLNIWVHDRNKQIGKDGLVEGLGVKTALNLEKFNVDVLGNIYPAPAESRRDLA